VSECPPVDFYAAYTVRGNGGHGGLKNCFSDHLKSAVKKHQAYVKID